MLLVGSSAIKHHFPDFNREPKDKDFFVDYKLQSTKEIEYLYNPILGHRTGIAKPNLIYNIKISHCLGWDINWEKHMWDIQFLKEKGCKENKGFILKHYKLWNELHGENKRSQLDMSSVDFFNNAVKCPYPHDWLHTLIKKEPTYTKILKENAEVDVSEEKFYSLSEQEKEDLVREEVYVMAFERFSKLDYRKAYNIMLKKFIISHAPIWEAIWIIQNHKMLSKVPFNYFNHLKTKIYELSRT